jgi:zinc transport system ATP-binding protein
MSAALEARGIRFGYGPIPIIDGADLTVDRGQFVVLTGPNGSGKSTLLKLVVGLLSPDRGEVRILGRPSSDPGARRLVGYAPQGSPARMVLPISVSEVVEAGLASPSPFSRRRPGQASEVESALASVGMTELARECVFELSGGQQQRAVIARALVGDRPLLMMDEPTTGIDRAFRPRLVDELRRRADGGTTVVVVSHDPDDFHDQVDRILFMEDGRVRDVPHGEYHAAQEASR